MVVDTQRDDIQCLTFSADSRWLFSSDGHTILCTPIDLDTLLAYAKRALGRPVDAPDQAADAPVK